MISRISGETTYWLFPEYLPFILRQQRPNGGWESYAVQEDGIVDLLAALLALKRHQSDTNQDALLQAYSDRAKVFLKEALQTLNLDNNPPIGFQIIVAALLTMCCAKKATLPYVSSDYLDFIYCNTVLEERNVRFLFPAKDVILALNKIKRGSFSPDVLYGPAGTTLLRTLEAFVNRIRHRKSFGSMMCLLASTAAYLMHISSWDEEAEQYLRRAIVDGSEKGSGAVSSDLPTPIFEISWVGSVRNSRIELNANTLAGCM